MCLFSNALWQELIYQIKRNPYCFAVFVIVHSLKENRTGNWDQDHSYASLIVAKVLRQTQSSFPTAENSLELDSLASGDERIVAAIFWNLFILGSVYVHEEVANMNSLFKLSKGFARVSDVYSRSVARSRDHVQYTQLC